MKQINKPMFETSDGEVFSDKLEATFHETTIQISDDITDYFKTLDAVADKDDKLSDRSKSMHRRIILEWEQHRAVQEMDNVTDINDATVSTEYSKAGE